MPRSQRPAFPPCAERRMRHSRTSIAVLPGGADLQPDRRHSASKPVRCGRRSDKSAPSGRTMDAIGKGSRASQCYGCLIAELYNRGRPHAALGPGVPDPPPERRRIPRPESRHRLPAGAFVLAKSVLGGLHHEYFFEAAVTGPSCCQANRRTRRSQSRAPSGTPHGRTRRHFCGAQQSPWIAWAGTLGPGSCMRQRFAGRAHPAHRSPSSSAI